MTTTSYLDDPRGRQSEALAYEAERILRRDLEGARTLYAKAARLEAAVALDVPRGSPRVRSALAVSAVALWYKAGCYQEALALAYQFLAAPPLAPDAEVELQSILSRCWRAQEIEAAKGAGEEWVPVEIILDGGDVRRGVAPGAAVRDRQQTAGATLTRITEWMLGEPFRYRGDAPERVRQRARLYEAPAFSSSYGLQLYVVSSAPPTQGDLPGSPKVSAADVVSEFLDLALVMVRGPASILERVSSAAYARAFLLGLRDLAPDGERVGIVSLGGGGMLAGAPVVKLEPQHRHSITQALAANVSEPRRIELEGVLKVVHLRGNSPHIEVQTAPKTFTRFRVSPGQFDDTIGPKLNRQVRVIGEHSATGMDSPAALDIVPIEPHEPAAFESP